MKKEEKLELSLKDKITSLELVKEINKFREMEFLYKKENGLKLTKTEEKNGRFVELKHYDLLKIIRLEFEEEIGQGKISLLQQTQYLPNGGHKSIPYFELTLDQAKQVLLRESRYVRRAVIEYIDKLEEQNRQLKEILSTEYDNNKQKWIEQRIKGKVTRKSLTDVIKLLIPYAVEQGSKNSKMLYMTYTKLLNSELNIPSNSRDFLTTYSLFLIETLEKIIKTEIIKGMEHNLNYKEIYKECKVVCDKMVEMWNKADIKIEFSKEYEEEYNKLIENK